MPYSVITNFIFNTLQMPHAINNNVIRNQWHGDPVTGASVTSSRRRYHSVCSLFTLGGSPLRPRASAGR
jgi:hypothetical protein